MKIRPSLRLYFLIAMLATGVVTIVVMSAISVMYFFSGMDIAMQGAMRAQAFHNQAEYDFPGHTPDFTVAEKWDELPRMIQENFDEQSLSLNKLTKKIDGIPLITAPKTGYFVMKVAHGDAVRYIAAEFNNIKAGPLENRVTPHFLYILLSTVAAIALFSGVLVFTLHNVATPVEKLKTWAKDLSNKNLALDPPDFHYSELNTLAAIIQSSLSSVQESVQREQRFLAYASHELRTPIAVTRTNAELLRKMMSKDFDKYKLIPVLERIERAHFTMTDLTETLLWLNRQDGKPLPVKELAIGGLLQQLQQELSYLLTGKSVHVTLKTDATMCSIPESLVRIVMTNLLRNAFQHTDEGQVIIEQSAKTLTITNQNNHLSSESNDLGFGLGLELTERLIKQYEWRYETLQIEHGRRVELSFETRGKRK